MRNLLKKMSLMTIIMAVFLAVIPITASAASKVKVTIDGKAVSFDVSPQVINGRTMVPYKAIAEKLGGKVKFDQSSKKATITKDTNKIELAAGKKTVSVNGKSVTLDAAPVNAKGDLLVPLRFVGESLGVWVNWNAKQNTAALLTKKTITHSLGTTTLNSVPKRAVILFNGGVDISVLLGVKPVGAVESYVQQPFYEYIRPSLIGTKTLGDETQPNIEAIVALKPDVIIATKVRHEKIYSQLSKIAPTVVTEDLADWKDNLQVAASVFNKEDKAEQFLTDWKAQVADFKKKLSAKDRGAEVSIIRINPNGSARAYNSGFAYQIFEELGFSVPKQQAALKQELVTVTSKEQVSLLDGDYIFDFTTDWDGDGAIFKLQKEWIDSPLWANLKAVKNKKYYKVNAVTWNLSGGALAAEKMLNDLYFYFDLND
ncbi:ABC-type Fe3+-hydroxamate transport system substrate-binding protein [Fontibacillus solani]|uniref:ABC-type Fe3+-hydroxamate transport system substrate-binding protein n=1 Tax=Fontibacillus solani TaxID=1572857 RepID=A0A7W3XU49_9BACL|nr:stalk domain-containing protein [Fontibacillus solani]MBA9088249.1 ABC-type Fe3+-hydroxamate transport system substrate-binding protein [Fontibacillus solani]